MSKKKSEDLFQTFLTNYEQGNTTYALQKILQSPLTSYDSLYSEEEAFPFLVNYCDALVFGTLIEAFYANTFLRETLESNPKYLSQFKKTISLLKLEGENLISSIVSKSPHQNQMQIYQSWMQLKTAKPQLETLFPSSSIPWRPFQYPDSAPISFRIPKKAIPVIFLEPTQQDLTPILTSTQGRPAIFVCETIAVFFQMLQYEEIVQIFAEQNHLIYILELYPHEQLLLQDCKKLELQNFKPLFLIKNRYPKKDISQFIELFKNCLEQNEDEFFKDTKAADLLYKHSKALIFNSNNLKFGDSRHAALLERKASLDWYDRHKSLFTNDQDDISENFQKKLEKLSKKRHPRKIKKNRKLKLAHIVPQIVDEGHAPSRLLESILLNHDKDKFDLFLFSTERLAFRPMEYPFNLFVSLPSKERGKDRISLFEDKGIPIYIDNLKQNYFNTAENLSEFLKELEIDIVVFHGPDCMNYYCSQMTEVPLRVFFEHGTLPSYPGFDLIIASTEDAQKLFQEDFHLLKSEIHSLPFSIDVRNTWNEAPFLKSELGFPEDSFVMTTISNHLDSRLSTEMLNAISEILKRCPQAYYAPMGRIAFPEKLQSHFEVHGLNKRVVIMGSKENPSQYARSMDLYLNEFPFGSCLGMLDAMASGCPVVSMYDPKGPSQARYGGSFFGMDHVITLNNVNDYIELACSLITDKVKYIEWSQYAKNQYNKRIDVKAYVNVLEQLLVDHLDGL